MSKTETAFKILVAEDNLVNQLVVNAFLSELGHDVVIVNDGQQAVDLLGSDHFDMVFMDIEMPVLDGRQATQAIRKGAAGVINSNIPIVALTAHDDDDERERSAQAGMNDFLCKPLDLERIRAVIDKEMTDSGPGPIDS